MTNEEAFKIMKLIPDDIEDLYGGYPYTEEEEFKLLAIDRAIMAIEKRIPMKPKYICNDAYCICGNAIKCSSKFCDEYCDHCGQKIDWSGE